MVVSKISASALNFITVPLSSTPAVPISWTSVTGIPLSKDCWYILPSLVTVAVKISDKAFTTETPTPWSPPDTL